MKQPVEQTLEWIGKWDTFSIKLGLDRMEWMLERLDHPERLLRAVHIGGTNGKGSTTTFLENILRQSNYSVGSFTSPSITVFNDRIKWNGQPISDEVLVEAVELLRPIAEELTKTDLGAPTEFEVITMIAVIVFAKVLPCDFVLFEVGLGGRYDSTNILNPLLSIITNVGLDHVKQLGGTYKEIAYQKAGIIKQGIPLVTAATGEALEVIIDTAQTMHSKIYLLGEKFEYTLHKTDGMGETFDFKSPFKKYDGLSISLTGEHQVKNASLALMASEYLRNYNAIHIQESELKEALLSTYWPGRFEKISEHPLVILDGAHNPEGIESLVETIRKNYPDYKVRILFATLLEKEYERLLHPIAELSDQLVLTGFEHHRAIEPEALLPYTSDSNDVRVEEDWKQGYDQLVSDLKENEMLLITGTLYFIAEVKKVLC